MYTRYKENIGYITQEHQDILLTKTVALIGCGGIGGYILEFLARLGLKKIIIFEGDTFEESNLNRQRFCYESNINKSKIQESINELKKINSLITYEYYDRFFTLEDINLLSQCNIIIHAADGNQYSESCRKALRRLILEDNIPVLEAYNIENGMALRFSTRESINAFDKETESWIYNAEHSSIISQPAYSCAIIAGLVVSECYKYLCNNNPAINRFILFDIKHNFLENLFST